MWYVVLFILVLRLIRIGIHLVVVYICRHNRMLLFYFFIYIKTFVDIFFLSAANTWLPHAHTPQFKSDIQSLKIRIGSHFMLDFRTPIDSSDSDFYFYLYLESKTKDILDNCSFSNSLYAKIFQAVATRFSGCDIINYCCFFCLQKLIINIHRGKIEAMEAKKR